MAQYDLIARDASGRTCVVVEAKRRPGTDVEWAKRWRQNALGRGTPTLTDRLFVLATPDKIYIWAEGAPADAPPGHELSATSLLSPYFDRAGIAPDAIEPGAFELLVALWLEELASVPPDGHADGPLATTGLVDALAGTRLVREDAA